MYVRILERREISFEQIGHRDRAGVGSDLDASPLLDHVGKVALEYLARLGKRHGRVSAELFLSSLSISPLLRHPIGRHAFRDRKSVVEGKRVSVRVDLGGRRIIKKKKIESYDRIKSRKDN